jgi:hypothetical protein
MSKPFNNIHKALWRKFVSVCGRHLLSMNFPLTNWEGYYAYSSRVEEIMPTYRCKNPPTIEE